LISSSKCEISEDVSILPRSTGRRYEAVLRLSEALSQSDNPAAYYGYGIVLQTPGQ